VALSRDQELVALRVLGAVGVVAALPVELLAGMSEAERERVVRVVERELEYRRPEELAVRIRRRLARWQGREVRRPVAVALTVVRRGYDCPRPDCEDHMLPSGFPCGACSEIGRQVNEGRRGASEPLVGDDHPPAGPETPKGASDAPTGPLSASQAPPVVRCTNGHINPRYRPDGECAGCFVDRMAVA
jgi:hypothetical protein